MEWKTVTLGGRQTRYHVFGEENQPPMLFVHGWGGSAESFTKLAEKVHLYTQMRTIIVDFPGFGEADPPDPSGWGTYEYARWLEAFVKALGIEKAVFYGHSFGCRVLVRLAIKSPDMIERMIFTGAAGIKLTPTMKQHTAGVLSGILKHSMIKGLIPEKIKNVVLTKVFGARDWANVPPELKETLRKVLAEDDFRHELSSIHCPVLLIWGKKDTLTPLAAGKIYETHLEHSTLKILPDGKHGIHHTHPMEMVQFIRMFLADKT